MIITTFKSKQYIKANKKVKGVEFDSNWDGCLVKHLQHVSTNVK